MSKLLTSAVIAVVLLTGAATAQTKEDKASHDHREAICKQLQRNCT